MYIIFFKLVGFRVRNLADRIMASSALCDGQVLEDENLFTVASLKARQLSWVHILFPVICDGVPTLDTHM